MCIFAPQVYVLIVSHVLYGFHWGFHGMINKRVCQNFHQWENCSVKTRLDSQTFFTLEQLIASSGLLTRNARWLIGVWSRIWQQNTRHCKPFLNAIYISQSLITWNTGLLGRSSRRLTVQSLLHILGVKQWVW